MKPLSEGVILIVDDEEVNRYTTGRILRDAGYTVIEAKNGQQALRSAGSLPDLILLDVNLPDMDGFQVCRMLKSLPVTARIPVVHASATFVSDRDKAQGLDDGADGYLTRPFEPCVLVATIRSCIRARRAEETISQKERELQTLANNTPDILGRFDREFRHQFVNAAITKVIGIVPEAIIGKTQREVGVPEPICHQWENAIRTVFDTGQNQSIEFSFDGLLGHRHYIARLVPEWTDAGVIEQVLAIVTDVTESKAAEESLREADRQKNDFLATLAHELRNPLAPIRNGLQIMRLVQGDPKAVEQTRSMIERQITQMVRLVDDLLDMARISQGKLELRREQGLLTAVLNSAVEGSRPLIEQLGHHLTVTIPKTPIVVDADMTRLAQIFLNLLNNAAKYSEKGSRIWLIAERQGNEVVVSVRDTGIGIAPEQLPQIFKMFSQLDRSLEKTQGGLGIGLTLVKRIAEMHGGSIEAKSEGPGMGSEFVVRLPIVVPGAAPQIDDANNANDIRTELRILIVDDNQDSADSLAWMLRAMGNSTATAYDGEAAVEKATSFQPDVILLDIGLPKLNGYEACRRIRERHGKNLVIIAQTGWGQEEHLQHARAAGFNHHLVKPIDPQLLMKILVETRSVKK